ncbi:hypothetical protein HAX54_004799 [Datura stramonium]|uniref:Uncharacterized protein n=1 Tax=Datura stramonium TaxID=4076 RepID=A0ABS8WV72_DATST|nr:hypothetical protein [Datura stramonium]
MWLLWALLSAAYRLSMRHEANLDMLGFCDYRDLLLPCNVGIGIITWHLMLGIWGWCLACAAGAFVHMIREWCLDCAVRLHPYLSSDILTCMPSRSHGARHKLGLLEVGFTVLPT